jgi:plastocyanin
MRTIRALAVVLLLVVGLSACGSDDGDAKAQASSSTTAPASDDAGGYGGGSSSGSTATDAAGAAAGAKVSIKDFAFGPATVEVAKGATVTVTNADTATHTWTLDDGSFDSGKLAPGKSAMHTFDSAGSFSYHCEIHTSMKGTVEVR